MPSAEQTALFRFSGGWATDFGTTLDGINPNAINDIPFMLQLDNARFSLNGAIRKIGGTTKYNAAAVGGGGNVTGVYDFWSYDGGATGTQKIVGHVGTVLYDFSGGANIATGLTADAIPDYTTFDDLLIYTSNSDAPRSWDKSTDQVLGGSPPNFSFSTVHKNRVFAAGVATAGSTLYWCAAEDPEDWTGVGSGAINVNPDDGDVITAIASYRNELWIFKGPRNRSIHRLVGSAPSGGDPFRVLEFAEGVTCAAQRLLFKYGNHLGFMDVDGAVYRLADTEATASSYLQASLSLPINGWLRDHVKFDRLKYGSAAVDRARGYVVFNFTKDSGASNNTMILMDFRFDPPRWSNLQAFRTLQCVGTIIDNASDNLPRVMAGGDDGFLRRFDTPTRSIDGSTTYYYNWVTPAMSMGDPFFTKTLSAAALGLTPQGNATLSFRWKRDGNGWQSANVTQVGGDVLGPAPANVFKLNSSTLGSGDAQDVYIDLVEGGEFRRVQFQAAQPGLNQDSEVHNLAVRYKLGTYSLEATSQ